MTYSDQFNNAAWSNTNNTITANAVASPSGIVDAEKIADNSATFGAHFISQNAALAGTTYTLSVYAKEAEYSFVQLHAFGNSGVVFNLSSGVVVSGTGGSITPAGNGWYRCNFTFAATNTTVFISQNRTSTSGYNYAGTIGSGIYIYGAQLEAGAFATSYIPTAAASATRNADVAFVATSQFPYSATEGALVVSADYIGQNPGVTYFAALDDGTTTNFMGIRRNPGGEASLIALASGVNQVIITGAIIPNNTTFKSSFAYKLNDYALTLNGALSGTDTTGTVPSVSRLSLGNIANILQMSGHIRQVTYIPRRLTNAELEARTA